MGKTVYVNKEKVQNKQSIVDTKNTVQKLKIKTIR
jgi:hypothetical protein